PQISEWSLDDIQFRADQWLIENIADEFSLQESVAIWNGNGTNKPTGFVNTSPTTTADFVSPLRAAASFQYVNSIASPFSVNGSDALTTLVYTLNSQYRVNATWAMNSATMASVRSLKDTTNNYIFQPALAAGTPSTLLGFPLIFWEQMDSIGSGTF